MTIKLKKRGMSEVVTTVLIILITVVAGAIIARFVIPFVRDSLNQGSECVGYIDYFKFEEKIEGINYNCYQNGYYYPSVKANAASRGKQDNIVGFNLVLAGSSTQAESKEINVPSSQVIMYDGSQAGIPKSGEVFTYKYSSPINDYKSAKVYPILKSGQICESSDEITIQACGAGVQ